MHTAGPAAGATHTAFELRDSLLDADVPRLRFFARRNPANPLIARERSNVLPYGPRCRR